MAFCPECGKPVAADSDSDKCVNCGKTLPHQAKKQGGARFKGTVMMAAPDIATAASAVATPQRAAGVAAHAKHVQAAKATMIGAGVAPVVPMVSKPITTPATAPKAERQGAVQQVVHVPVSAPPPAPESSGRISRPGTRRHVGPAVVPTSEVAAQPERPVLAAVPEVTAEVVEPALDPHVHTGATRQYLPGDPMGPQPSAAGRSARLRLSRFSQDDAYAVPKGERNWVYWAVCAVVVASALVLAIGLF